MMSQENVEMIRSIYEQGLLDSTDAHNALAETEIEYVNPPDAIDAGVRRGRGLRTALSNLTDAFDEREHQLKRIFDGGDTVVADVVFRGRGASSGATVTHDEAHTWTFDGTGRIIRFEWGRDLTAALEAVGLAE
jgi:ketosteroid isomerase-like protein